MLNIFPSLLMPMLGPLLLRLVVGLVFIDLGILKLKSEKSRWLTSFESLRLVPADLFVTVYAALQILGGVLLILGLWTQLAALAFVIFTGIELYVEMQAKEILRRDVVFYLFLFVISVSLLFTGAGSYAIDIPL